MADTKYDIKCPACGTVMKKIWTDENFYVDVCSNGCGGVWFDNRELDKFSQKDKDATIIFQEYKNKEFVEVDKDKIRKCPVCHAKMVKNRIVKNNNIEIDECYTCGGKFLDKDELKAIRNSNELKNEDIDYLFNYLTPSTDEPSDERKEQIRQLILELIQNLDE